MINRFKGTIAVVLFAVIAAIGSVSCSNASAENESSVEEKKSNDLIGEWVAKGPDGCMSFEFCKDGTALFRETRGDIVALKERKPVLYDYKINGNRIALTIEGGKKIQNAEYSVKADGKILILKFDGDRSSIKFERQ